MILFACSIHTHYNAHFCDQLKHLAQGATKGNSGIVHAGFDDAPGSNRAKFCWPGNQMFAELDMDLHFGYQKNGSLVLATNEEEVIAAFSTSLSCRSNHAPLLLINLMYLSINLSMSTCTGEASTSSI